MESNLEVWKTAHQLTLAVYKVTQNFPKSEQFGLTSQVRRSASSVPTNIIEGQARQYKKEFVQFLYISKGSLEETNYHLFLSKELGYISEDDYKMLAELCTRIKMMLYKLITTNNEQRTTNNEQRTTNNEQRTLSNMINKHSITHVILTGGVGSRLWPLSRKSRPKQYLDIFDGKSLFEMTVDRNRTIADKVMVVGNIDNCHLSRKILEQTNTPYIDIVESTPRNTAAAIAFAAFASDPEDILIITPSDHIIDEMQQYQAAIEEAVEKAGEGLIVTFGIVPSKPETGYGYIERKGDAVVSFREKPNQVTAAEFIARGNFLWNSGMFCFKAGVLLEELKTFHPEVYEKSKLVWESNINGNLDLGLSLDIPSISIDYAVMERSRKIKVVSSKFAWSDLGSFESVYDYLVSIGHAVDENGNMVIGTTNYTAFIGVKDTIFVCTPTANLILKKEFSQDVKSVYNALERDNSDLLN